MVLSCGHSICKVCVDQLRAGTKVVCPFDKTQSVYIKICPNFSLMAVLESKSLKPKCVVHPAEVTHFYCSKDQIYIC